MGSLMIKTHPYGGHGHNKDVAIPGQPSFSSIEEAYAWANSTNGATELEGIFKDQFDQGEMSFTVEYS